MGASSYETYRYAGTEDTPDGPTLTVIDDQGNSTTTTAAIAISNAAPVISSLTGPSSASEGELLSFSAEASDPGANDTITYAWDFGDGNTTTGAGPCFFSSAWQQPCPDCCCCPCAPLGEKMLNFLLFDSPTRSMAGIPVIS